MTCLSQLIYHLDLFSPAFSRLISSKTNRICRWIGYSVCAKENEGLKKKGAGVHRRRVCDQTRAKGGRLSVMKRALYEQNTSLIPALWKSRLTLICLGFNFSRSFRIIAKRTWFQAGAIPSIGLTKLYEPEDAASAIADVVFVHGLTGGAHTTWLHRRGAQQVYWPSDLLPKDCPNTRILTFGYDANVTQFWGPASSSRVNNHAESLLGSLSRLRARTDTVSLPRMFCTKLNVIQEHRPVIFVAHSLGGLVTQYALSISRTSPEPDIALLETHTQGIAFLGTPHHGSDYAAWGTLASDLTRWLKRTNRDIIAVLQPQSEILATIQKGFQRLLSVRQSSNHRIAVTCFYEELPVTGISEVSAPYRVCL